MVALALSHAVALALVAQPPGPPPAPVLTSPAPHEVSFGRVAGEVGPTVERVTVVVDGRTLGEAAVGGRRFETRVALPARAVRVRVVAHDLWGRRSATRVGPVLGLPAAAAPRATTGFLDRELARRVDSLVGDYDGTSAVYVQDLVSGAGAAWNAKARFPAASTVKVAIAIEVLRRLERTGSRSRLSRLLETMLVDSDNEAANELLVWLGGSVSAGAAAVSQLMRSLGLLDSHLYGGFLVAAHAREPIPVEIESSPVLGVEKYTSAWDLAQTHRALHLAAGGRGPLLDLPGSFTAADARHLLYVLARSADRGKLDRHLRGRALVPHKAGWIEDARHDAGLVYSPGGVFVVAVLTWNANGVDETSADTLAGDVARAAFERFDELRGAASARATPAPPLRL